MGKPTDQNQDYMREMWGTTSLITDYNPNEKTPAKMLREISHDLLVPKKHDFIHQNEIHEVIRNDGDYDDWEYGTEPIPLSEWKP